MKAIYLQCIEAHKDALVLGREGGRIHLAARGKGELPFVPTPGQYIGLRDPSSFDHDCDKVKRVLWRAYNNECVIDLGIISGLNERMMLEIVPKLAAEGWVLEVSCISADVDGMLCGDPLDDGDNIVKVKKEDVCILHDYTETDFDEVYCLVSDIAVWFLSHSGVQHEVVRTYSAD